MANLSINYIKSKNCDFKDFFINNIGRPWYYPNFKNKEKVYIREEIRDVFSNILIEQKNNLDTFICKTSAYTSQRQSWDIKFKGNIYTNILFNIPNNEVRTIVYSRKNFMSLLSKIEISLENEKGFKNLLDKKQIVFIILLLTLLFKKKLERFLDVINQKLIASVQLINIANVKQELFGSHKIKTVNYILSYNREGNTVIQKQYSNTIYQQFAQILISKVEVGYQKQKSLINQINKKQIDSNYLEMRYFHLKEGNIYITNVNLSPYKEFDILYEIREYISWHIMAKKKISNKLYHLKEFFINFISDTYQFKNFSSFNIDKEMAQTFSLYLMSNQDISTRKSLSISSRKEIFTVVKNFFTFIVKHEISKKYKLQQLTINPFEYITLTQVEKHKKHYQPLPEEVYWQIMDNISELEIDIKHAFIVLSATGFRWSEIIGLEEDCLYVKNNQVYIKSIEHKTKRANLKKGNDTYRHIPLFDQQAIQSIEDQIQIHTQQNINSKLIFHKRSKKFYSSNYILISNNYYNESINNLIKKYNIKTDDNQYWHYTSHQMRTRIATLMAENGFESEEIANFLNHTSINTINKAYAFVRKKRMAELNTNFFKEHFNSIIPAKNLNSLTKKEREDLYVHLTLDYRQMEYGKCIIPMSQGDCGKLQESESCASCEYLITSKDYLPKWEYFLSNQESRIKKLEEFYLKNKLSNNEYESYIEYQREVSYLEKYQDIVNNLRSS